MFEPVHGRAPLYGVVSRLQPVGVNVCPGNFVELSEEFSFNLASSTLIGWLAMQFAELKPGSPRSFPAFFI